MQFCAFIYFSGVWHVCNSGSSKDEKTGRRNETERKVFLDINQTVRLKKAASETVSNMEFCLSIAQIGPLIPLDEQSMKQMALNWLILSRGNFSLLLPLSICWLLFLAPGGGITEEQSATCFSLRFKDVLAAPSPGLTSPHLFLSARGADRGTFHLVQSSHRNSVSAGSSGL